MPTATSHFYRWIKLELSNTDSTLIKAKCDHCKQESSLENKVLERLLEMVKRFENMHCMCTKIQQPQDM